MKQNKTKHPLYSVYSAMIYRCYGTRGPTLEYYKNRGITVCDRWRNNFWNFVEDMAFRPEGYQLDRIDNNGNYEPNNCRWITQRENNQNAGHCKWWFIKGKRFASASEAANYYNINTAKIYNWVKSLKKPDCYSELKYAKKS